MDLARVRRPVRIVKLHVQPIPFCFASIRAAATARSIDGIWPSIGRLTRATLNIRTTLAEDQLAIEAVLDAAFGTDRHERTAYQVRAGVMPIASLSLVAEDAGRIVGSLPCRPVETIGRAH